MKGIIIWEDNERATYCELINNAYSELTQYAPKTIMCSLKGESLETSKASCNKDDTYDFETGALIALMKMCGVDKVVRACNEAFPKETYNTYITKFENELNTLKKDFDKVRDLKDFYKKNYEDVKEHYGKLGDRNKYLIEDINKKLEYIKEKDEEIKELKSDKDKSWKNYQRNIQKKQDRINELERAYKASNDDEAKLVEYYQREIKKLEAEKEKLKKNIDELFESEQHSKSELGRLYFEKHCLEEKVEKLKIDCEKLQHGYIDTDNVPSGHWDGDILDIVFLPGRACGKQYKALVELFKKTPKEKVETAYKEAYNTVEPVWQKEYLNRMYDIYKKHMEKTELPRTLDINGTTYRKSIQIKDFGEQINKLTVDPLIEQSRTFTRKCVDEWLYKNPTKREEMWDDILKEGRTTVYVKREDVYKFLEECQKAGIKWSSGKMPLETVPFNLSEGYDGIYFFVMTSLDISKSNPESKEFRHVMSWWMTASDEEARNSIKYIPPMRWDLFKKGRLAVKVTPDNYKEFYEACEKVIGKRPVTAVFTEDFTVSICKKDGLFEIFSIEDQKKTGRKIVDWEDVR